MDLQREIVIELIADTTCLYIATYIGSLLVSSGIFDKPKMVAKRKITCIYIQIQSNSDTQQIRHTKIE